jgi:hypothetical protein
MGTLELRFYRYKLNHIKCTCGISKRFTVGMDARFFADRHYKEHEKNDDPVEFLVFQNDELTYSNRTAKPGRHAGNVSLQNLY